MTDYLKEPQKIESDSFRLIEEIAGAHGLTDEQWPVVRRMIHTTADFDYNKNIRFHPQAILAGLRALKAGSSIVTDTRMLQAGISTGRLAKLNVETYCFVDDPEVAADAHNRGVTRSIAAVDRAVAYLDGGIAAIGNAPTALLHLMELVDAGKIKPALIIGIPVGFINAAESKEILAGKTYPFITSLGRKGGSPVVAGVINALAVRALEEIKNDC